MLYVASYEPGSRSIPVKSAVIMLALIVKFDLSRDILQLLSKQIFILMLGTSGILKGRTIDILSSESPFALRPILGAGKGSSLVPEEERERERERGRRIKQISQVCSRSNYCTVATIPPLAKQPQDCPFTIIVTLVHCVILTAHYNNSTDNQGSIVMHKHTQLISNRHECACIKYTLSLSLTSEC